MNHPIDKILLLLFFLTYSAAYAESSWHSIKDEQGIQIFNRDIAGSEIKEFKAVAVIDAPMEVIFEVMADVSAGTQWMDNCIESKMLKTIGKGSVAEDEVSLKNLVYHAVGAPFPVNNRDFIMETEMKINKKNRSMMFAFHALSDSGVPVRKNYVRMTDLKGSWTFEYIDAAHTRAVYQVKQNPGGNLPAYIVNYVNKEAPYKTIIGLRKIVKNDLYIKAAQLKTGTDK